MFLGKINLTKRTLLVIITIVSGCFIGLIILQVLLLRMQISSQYELLDDKIDATLLDLHHNIEDDQIISEKLIHILSNLEDGTAINQRYIDNTINEVLYRLDSISLKNGIDLSFDFIIYNTFNDKVVIRSSDHSNSKVNYKLNTIKAGWRIKEALGEGKYRFGIHYYNQFIYVLKKTSLFLGISMILMLALIGSFSFTIFSLFRQKKLSEIKNDFINNLTHELKTPIFSISVIHKVLRQKLNRKMSAEYNQYLDLLENENNNLRKKVEGVLDIAMIENGSLELKLREVNIHQVIEKAIKRYAFVIEQKNGEIKVVLNANKVNIQLDEEHLINVINNLLDNAIKYCEKQPEILITTKDINNGIEIIIADNGIGIDKKDQSSIFEKFYRVSTGNIHKIKGFGIGLSYVKMIVEKHKGKIQVQSKLGEGTEFIIFIPHE